MNGSLLNRANQVKYLGIIIDHKLNWVQHITYVKIRLLNVLVLCIKQEDF